MTEYVKRRQYTFRPQPLSHTNRMKLHAKLDAYYETHTKLWNHYFDDVCEEYRCHPTDMRAALRLYDDTRYRAIHGHRRGYKPYVRRTPVCDPIWDNIKPFGGWHFGHTDNPA